MKYFSFIVFIVLTVGVILPLTALISYMLNLKHFISIPASERNRGDCITSSLIGLRTICLLELPTDHLVSLKAPSTGRQREIEPNPRLLRTKSAGFYLIFPHLNTVCCIMQCCVILHILVLYTWYLVPIPSKYGTSIDDTHLILFNKQGECVIELLNLKSFS